MTKASNASPTGPEKELIDLLLEEYRTLRAEQTSRVTGQFNLLSYGAAGTALVFGLSGDVGRTLVVLLLLLVPAILYYALNSAGMAHTSRHLSLLEQRVNDLTRAAGWTTDDVLTWETGQFRDPTRSRNPMWRLLRRRYLPAPRRDDTDGADDSR